MGMTADDYSEAVRLFSKKYISYKYTRGSSSLSVFLMDPQIEKRLSQFDDPLTDEEKSRLIEAVEKEFKGAVNVVQTTTILTSMEVRRALREVLKRKFPNLVVLSYQELAPETNIQPIARISWIETETAAVS